MKIAYYCQHVLGIGHFHRSLEICRKLSRNNQVTFILGGPDIEFDDTGLVVYQLPGLQMDSSFRNLHPCDAVASLEETKTLRRDRLFAFFQDQQPDVFIVELYPFGRKAFRFELDPVLSALRDGTLSPCKCYVSLRDILVERPDDKEKFEQRIITTLNRFFDGLLIHSDENIITLEETFDRVKDINIPTAYTGFITRQSGLHDRAAIRKQLQIAKDQTLIVVSIGGGNVGGELLFSSVEAFSRLSGDKQYRMQIFSGPYFPEVEYRKLQSQLTAGITLERFSDSFPAWLEAADLSISMAGYNTSMNILQAGVPALVYPFTQNREQRFRIEKIEKFAAVRTLAKKDLDPDQLADTIKEWSTVSRYSTAIRLDGAEESTRLVERGFL